MIEQALIDGICAEGGQPPSWASCRRPPSPSSRARWEPIAASSSRPAIIRPNTASSSSTARGWASPRCGRGRDAGDCRGDPRRAGRDRPGPPVPNAALYYANHAAAVLQERGVDLSGMKIAVDCAHGASCETTPATLRALGAEVFVINGDPDGSEINVGCGSTHLEPVKFLMESRGADIAIAHDGDADRMLALAPDGTVIDGDFLLAICARISRSVVCSTTTSSCRRSWPTWASSSR